MSFKKDISKNDPQEVDFGGKKWSMILIIFFKDVILYQFWDNDLDLILNHF
jgi:hypothetical protein